MTASARPFPIACAAALALVVAAYANHFRNEFHFDDDHTIQTNLYIRDIRNIPRFFADASTFSSLPTHQSYRPLVTTTVAIDYRVGGGLNPSAFHATNFALFLVQCGLMFSLYRRVMEAARPDGAAQSRWLALFGAAWYGVHAANAETVNYIIARSEILSTLGVVLAFVLFIRGGFWRRTGLYLLPAAAGILAKEQAAMFAPLLFVYVALFERAPARTIVRTTMPAFAVCGALAAFGQAMARSFVSGGASRWLYLITQPYVIVHYVLTFFAPIGLSADTEWQPLASPFDFRFAVGVLSIAGLLALAWKTSQRIETSPVAFGVLWFFIALLPTSSVIPLAEVLNDHRTFFPYVGLTLAAVYSLTFAPFAPGIQARRAIAVAAIVALAAMACATHQRNIVWRTEESLWLDVTQKSPRNGRGLMTYGVIRMGKGDYATADEYYQRALAFVPEYSYLHVNIGILKGVLGRNAEAEEHFRTAQRLDPENPICYFFYARWLTQVGRVTDAKLQARRALDLSPGYADARELVTFLNSRPQ